MKTYLCPGCKDQPTGYKRHTSLATVFAYIATFGFWVWIWWAYYPLRCIKCGWKAGYTTARVIFATIVTVIMGLPFLALMAYFLFSFSQGFIRGWEKGAAKEAQAQTQPAEPTEQTGNTDWSSPSRPTPSPMQTYLSDYKVFESCAVNAISSSPSTSQIGDTLTRNCEAQFRRTITSCQAAMDLTSNQCFETIKEKVDYTVKADFKNGTILSPPDDTPPQADGDDQRQVTPWSQIAPETQNQ